MDALKREGENDYVLVPGEDSVWITVGNVSVYIRRTDEGVSVCTYPFGVEEQDSITESFVTFKEAELMIEEAKEAE